MPIKGDCVFLQGNILSLYLSLNASSGALSAFLSLCVRTDTGVQFFFFLLLLRNPPQRGSSVICAYLCDE